MHPLRSHQLLASCLVLGLGACGGAVAMPPSAPLSSLGQLGGFCKPPSAPSRPDELVAVPAPGTRATIVDFWSVHCEPCKEGVPALQAAAPALAAEGIAVVLVGVLEQDGKVDAARAALRSWGVTAEFLIDREGGVEKQLGFLGEPAVVVLDREGIVRWAAPKGSPADVIAAAARAVAAR